MQKKIEGEGNYRTRVITKVKKGLNVIRLHRKTCIVVGGAPFAYSALQRLAGSEIEITLPKVVVYVVGGLVLGVGAASFDAKYFDRSQQTIIHPFPKIK